MRDVATQSNAIEPFLLHFFVAFVLFVIFVMRIG